MIYDADELVLLARTYMRAKDMSGTKLGTLSANNNRFVDRLLQGDGCAIQTAERLSDWLDANWPHGLPWPRHIRRRERLDAA